MAWKLTDGLGNLRTQVNARFPDRDHASDGTIGDAAHMAETSGHNPDDTAGSHPEWNGDPDGTAEVRAWDMDSDLRESGASAQMVVDHIRRLPNVTQVLRYMIYNRKIYSASNGWVPQTYSGASAHTEHIHFSGAYSQAADNNTSFNYRLDEINKRAMEDDMSAADATTGVLGYAGGGLPTEDLNITNSAGAHVDENFLNYFTELYGRVKALEENLADANLMLTRIAGKLEVPIPTPDN